VAAGMQFTFPGIPVVWAGDEFGLDGFNGEKSRTPIPWNDERPSDRSMIETYAQLAAMRKQHPALVDGSMRFVFADSDTLIYVRESKKERVIVLATRGKTGDVKIAPDAIPDLASAKLIYGKAKIIVGKKKAHFEAAKMTFAVWHLPAA